MVVLLREPATADGMDLRTTLTVGREYEVLGISCDNYRLLSDDGEPCLYPTESFEVVDPREPAFWMTEFGAEGERYAYPPGWGVPGFFEDWHDGVRGVRRAFAEQLTLWYPSSTIKG